MKRIAALTLTVVMAANGLAMLFAGVWWYGAVPGVTQTGPFNPHFVQDIGAAFLVAAAAFGWFAARPAMAWPAAVAGGAFLIAHALIHLAGAAGHGAAADLLRDLPGVYLPAAFSLWIILPEKRRA